MNINKTESQVQMDESSAHFVGFTTALSFAETVKLQSEFTDQVQASASPVT